MEKVLSKFSATFARNLAPTKFAFCEFFSPRKAIDISVTFSSVLNMTKITETRKTNRQVVLKSCFSVARIVIKLFEKIDFKQGASNGVWSVQEEHTSSNSHVPSRFGVKFDRNQLMISDYSAKYRKGSHRKSCRFWLAGQVFDCIFPILTSSVSVTLTVFDILKKEKHSSWKQCSFIGTLGFWSKSFSRHFKTAFWVSRGRVWAKIFLSKIFKTFS